MIFLKKEAREIQPELWEYDGYFFDLDGTIYLGEKVLPGIPESLAFLRKSGKQVRFLTNTTIRTRSDCRLRLDSLGLAADTEEIVTAGYASAAYLHELAGSPLVYVIGEPALVRELDEQGVRHTADVLEATHVLVGMDMHFDYRKLHLAMKGLRNGAALIAANPDPNCPVASDLIPDTGSLVKAIEAASGIAPQTIVGKPSHYFGFKVLEWCGLSADRCLMIGDRLETDVLFGAVNGFDTALVLTGITAREDFTQSTVMPDYVWDSMEDFLAVVRSSRSFYTGFTEP